MKTTVIIGVLAGVLALLAPTSFSQTYMTNTYRVGSWNGDTNNNSGIGLIEDSWARGLRNGGTNPGDANFDGDAAMNGSNFAFPHADTQLGFVAFHDLNIPTNAVVMKATLTLLCHNMDDIGNGADQNGQVNLGVSPLLIPFVASNVTAYVATSNEPSGPIVEWNAAWAEKRAPTYIFDGTYDIGPDEARAVVTEADVEYWGLLDLVNEGLSNKVSWNVTAGFAGQLAAGQEENGFVIMSRSPGDHDGRLSFRTMEYANQITNGLPEDLSPQLDVIWYTGAVQTLTLQVSPDDAWTTVTDIYSTKVPVEPGQQYYRVNEID